MSSSHQLLIVDTAEKHILFGISSKHTTGMYVVVLSIRDFLGQASGTVFVLVMITTLISGSDILFLLLTFVKWKEQQLSSSGKHTKGSPLNDWEKLSINHNH